MIQPYWGYFVIRICYLLIFKLQYLYSQRNTFNLFFVLQQISLARM